MIHTNKVNIFKSDYVSNIVNAAVILILQIYLLQQPTRLLVSIGAKNHEANSSLNEIIARELAVFVHF